MLLASKNTDSHTSLVTNHPLVQKMLADNISAPAILNGHSTVAVVATAAATEKKYFFYSLMISKFLI